MSVRLTKLDEYHFLTCVKHQVWGSMKARFSEWKQGDILIFIVNKNLAGLAEVSGPPYVAKERVWDNGTYPHRIPMKFTHLLKPENRPPVLGEIRDALTAAWGVRYGVGIINRMVLPAENAEVLLNAVRSKPNELSDICANLDIFMAEAHIHCDAVASAKPAEVSKPVPERETPEKRAKEQRDIANETTPQGDDQAEGTAHSLAQKCLIQLGKVTGSSVWIASNDRNRLYKGASLGEGCLKDLPNLGLSPEAIKRIKMIDAIWIRQNAPICAFEIEETTSVYSGLLRMSDLLAVVPALKIHLFIVAPRSRQQKVMEELARPTFQKIGLSEFCRFIAAEDLQDLLVRVQGLGGHVQPTIVDTIAIELEEVGESNMD